MYPPILGVDNVVSVLNIICDAEPHIFKLWDDGYFINPFLVETTLNGEKMFLIVGGSGICIENSKQIAVTFPNVFGELFILHLIVRV